MFITIHTIYETTLTIKKDFIILKHLYKPTQSRDDYFVSSVFDQDKVFAYIDEEEYERLLKLLEDRKD